jgi:hypothetical protein
MVPDVPLDHLRHQTIHGAARGRYEAQHVPALGFPVQGARERLDLATDARDPMRELLLLTNGV